MEEERAAKARQACARKRLQTEKRGEQDSVSRQEKALQKCALKDCRPSVGNRSRSPRKYSHLMHLWMLT